MGEHTFFATFFIFFSSRTEKCYSFSQTFFGSLRRFLHSLHSTPVASGRYVWSGGLLRPPLQTPRPFAPFVPFRSFRKVVRDPKKSFENEAFFCSLVVKKKVAKNVKYSTCRMITILFRVYSLMFKLTFGYVEHTHLKRKKFFSSL